VKNLIRALLEFTQTKSQYEPVRREFYGRTSLFGANPVFSLFNSEDDD